jgi:uridine kinase
VDYERFQEEILQPLKAGKAFSYRPFACKTFTLSEAVQVMPRQLNIVEGTYSLHPYFEDPYDLRIFLSVDKQTQQERILQRPAHLIERFFSDWIPMEMLYFDVLRIPERADIQLDMGMESVNK